MAACSEVEEKPSSSEEPLPIQIYVDNAASHDMRRNIFNNISNISQNHESSPELPDGTEAGDLNNLSDDEFLDLLKEASTFNKPPQEESVLLKRLREEVAVTESSSNVTYVETNCPSKFVGHPKTRGLLPNKISFNLQTSQRTKKYKHKNDSKSSSSDSNPNRSQSLKDLSVDLTKSKKSHKSHRTLSLSSEEAIAIISDPSVSSKTSKKSYKQSSSVSSKSELNKSGRGCSKVPQNSESVITLEIKDGVHSAAQSENLPYQQLENEPDIPRSSGRLDVSCEKESFDSPIEIEMEEIKSNKEFDRADNNVKEIKTKNGPQANSRFYVDHHSDVDATLSFPLKIVPVSNDQNEGVNDKLKNQAVLPHAAPLPRPLHIADLINSMPMGIESIALRNDKQMLATDINGNPFTKNSRSNYFPSLMANSQQDYSCIPNAETKNRKNKRAKNSANQGVLSEHIVGFRGNEDMETLLQFINSDDKKNKSSVKGSQNQLSSNKNVCHDHEKKKPPNKDAKSQKNLISSEKKKLTRSSSLENLPRSEVSSEVTYSYEAGDTRSESYPKGAVSFDQSITKHFDVNSNVESKVLHLTEKSKDSSSNEESGSQKMGNSSLEVSSFAADFYSTADVSSQTNEESGFLTVGKKKKKKQGKRSDSYRWRNTQTQRKKGIMLPLSESKCGKQDSRRKSTSSVPHSEHSSADNSDLDSVHSLPVQSSVPHPTRPQPHTTPSSSSSTPQASYADIARMPISKLNSPAPCIITYSGQSSAKQQSGEQETKKVDGSSALAFPQVKRRVSDSKESSTSTKGSSRVVAESKESSGDVKVRTYTKSTREINTQTEPLSPDISGSSAVGLSVLKKSEESEQLCTVCLLQKSECSCSKSQPTVRQKTKSTHIPPVIMDNMPPEANPCNVSFGFGIEEVLQMTPSKSTPPCPKEVDLDDLSSVKKSDIKIDEVSEKHRPFSVDRNLSASADSSFKCSFPADESKTSLSHDLPQEQSSHIKTVCIGSGKKIHYSETKVNVNQFNQSELANYFQREFDAIAKEAKDDKGKGKVWYYKPDSQDEA